MAAKIGPVFKAAMSAEHRVKIQNSNILNALIEHATGQRDMSPTQVTAGLGLLKKVLPDLSAVELSGELANPVSEMANDEFARLLEAVKSEGVRRAASGGGEAPVGKPH